MKWKEYAKNAMAVMSDMGTKNRIAKPQSLNMIVKTVGMKDTSILKLSLNTPLQHRRKKMTQQELNELYKNGFKTTLSRLVLGDKGRYYIEEMKPEDEYLEEIIDRIKADEILIDNAFKKGMKNADRS